MVNLNVFSIEKLQRILPSFKMYLTALVTTFKYDCCQSTHVGSSKLQFKSILRSQIIDKAFICITTFLHQQKRSTLVGKPIFCFLTAWPQFLRCSWNNYRNWLKRATHHQQPGKNTAVVTVLESKYRSEVHCSQSTSQLITMNFSPALLRQTYNLVAHCSDTSLPVINTVQYQRLPPLELSSMTSS